MIDQTKDVPVFLDSGWLTYLGVMAISFWAGLTSYLQKKKKFILWDFLAHISSASFAGLMAYFACAPMGINGPLVGVVCGVSAHMGTPALIKLLMKFKMVRNLLAEDKKE